MHLKTHAIHRIEIVKKQPLEVYRGDGGCWFIKITLTTPEIHSRVQDE
jgi:hypothetical protein